MGTNYYAVRNRPSIEEPHHIGKSSAGWLFNFQEQHNTWNHPPVVWHTWPQVKDWLKKYTVDSHEYVIMDEYDEIISYDNFVDIVEAKQNDPFCRDNPDNFTYSANRNGYRFSEGDFC
jgi:hypothetical protein